MEGVIGNMMLHRVPNEIRSRHGTYQKGMNRCGRPIAGTLSFPEKLDILLCGSTAGEWSVEKMRIAIPGAGFPDLQTG